MTRETKVWVFVNKKTGQLVWTRTGHPAAWSRRAAARQARREGLIPKGSSLVKLTPEMTRQPVTPALVW